MARPRSTTPLASPHLRTLDRGLRALEIVAAAESPMRLDEVAAALGVHRSVAYRMLRTLEDHRLVRMSADGQYEPGTGLSTLARGVARTLQSAALPTLTDLANDVGMTAFLVVREGDDVVTIASVEPRHSTAHVAYRPGARHPVDRGAPGIALLAAAPARPRERRVVTQSRRAGYAISHGEVLPGLSAAAAPVVTGRTVHAAVAVVFLDRQVDHRRLGRRLIDAASAVAAELRQQ